MNAPDPRMIRRHYEALARSANDNRTDFDRCSRRAQAWALVAITLAAWSILALVFVGVMLLFGGK